MTLTLGAHHHATGPAIFTISTPIGLVVTLSTIPNYVPHDVFTPVEYHGLGRLNVGNSFGYLPHVPLVTPLQLVYPLPDELTLLRVGPVSGLTVDIDEIVRPTVLNSALMPWDRGGQFWTAQASAGIVGVTGAVTFWTYTVPAGKILMLSQFDLTMIRQSAAAPNNAVTMYARVASAPIALVQNLANTVGLVYKGGMSAGPLYLPAATVVSADYNGQDAGGTHYGYAYAAGLLFNA